MNNLFLCGVFFGITAALLVNIGKGVQKQHIHVFKQGRKIFDSKNRKDLFIWLMGLTMTASASVFFSLGLKFSQSPSAISSLTGVGLIGLFIFAVIVIKENISLSDVIGIVIVIICTSLLGYIGASKKQLVRELVDSSLIKAIAIIVILEIAGCFSAFKMPKIYGICFGLVSGMSMGLAIFLGDAALVKAGGSFKGQLSNPYPYIALFFGAMAAFTTQIGFLKGRALEVVPAFNSSVILMPLFLEVIIYRNFPGQTHVLLIFLILGGVMLLSTGAAAKVSA